MKSLIALIFIAGTAQAQQLPTGPIQFVKDKKTVTVTQDTVNPLNTVGLPVSGTINASNPSVGNNSGVTPTSSTLIGGDDGGVLRPVGVTNYGGVNYLRVDTSGFINPGAATATNQVTGNASLSSIDGKLTSVSVGSLPSIPSGSNNIGSITNITGTVSLPTGAATDAKQDTGNSSLSSIDGKLTSVTVGTLPSIPSGSNNIGSLTNITGTVSLPTGAATSAKQDTTNTSLSSIDGKLTSVTVGTLPSIPAGSNNIGSITNVTGTVSLPTGAATSALQTQISGQLPTTLGAKTTANSMAVNIASDQTVKVSESSTKGEFIRLSYTSTNVTTAAYTQLIASTSAAYNTVEIFDSSGQTLKLAIGGAGSEVDQFIIFPGGNGRLPFTVPSGSRISVKALSNTANVGEIDINFYSN